jgi:hypothetical protein
MLFKITVLIKSIEFNKCSINAFEEEKDLTSKRIGDSFGISCSPFIFYLLTPILSLLPLPCKRWSGGLSPGKIFGTTNARRWVNAFWIQKVALRCIRFHDWILRCFYAWMYCIHSSNTWEFRPNCVIFLRTSRKSCRSGKEIHGIHKQNTTAS